MTKQEKNTKIWSEESGPCPFCDNAAELVMDIIGRCTAKCTGCEIVTPKHNEFNSLLDYWNGNLK